MLYLPNLFLLNWPMVVFRGWLPSAFSYAGPGASPPGPFLLARSLQVNKNGSLMASRGDADMKIIASGRLC